MSFILAICYTTLMRVAFINMAISVIILATSVAHGSLLPQLATRVAHDPLLPQVVEKRLANGIRILLVERPGTDVVHVHTFIKGGRSNVGILPPVAIDLLANTLFTRVLPNNVWCNPTEKIPNTKLAKIIDEAKVWDKLDSLGASGRSLVVTADYCSYGVDLPKRAIAAWSQVEFDRLNFLPMVRFPIEKSKLLFDIAAGVYPNNHYLYALLATALPGGPYAASSSNISQSCANSIIFDDIKNYARYAISPENITLILIGDINIDETMYQLEHTFGALLKSSSDHAQWGKRLSTNDNNEIDLLELRENRQLTISTNSDARIFFAWRVPSINHLDRTALVALTKILGDRCNDNIAASHNIVRKLTVKIGVPGQQSTNLLVIEAEPKDGYHTKELEHIIESEITKLQQEPISSQELHRLQAKMKLDELVVQEDAKILAETLGECICQGGDWRLAFIVLGASGSVTPYELQLAAQAYLSSHRMTTVLLVPDPMPRSINLTEKQIIQIFKKSLERKSGDITKVQDILGETLKQLHMLSDEEQLQLLKLLENKVYL